MKMFPLILVLLFASCANVKEPNIKADKGIFLVQGIESIENDSSKVLCKYRITSDTLSSSQDYDGHTTDRYNPFIFFLTDTSGKYKIGDTLILILKTQDL